MTEVAFTRTTAETIVANLRAVGLCPWATIDRGKICIGVGRGKGFTFDTWPAMEAFAAWYNADPDSRTEEFADEVWRTTDLLNT